MRWPILILFPVLVAGPSSGLDNKHLSMLLNDRKCPDGDFSEGCLRSYNLSMCDLVGADFRGANLRHTNLRGADLRKAAFDGADLTGADLTKARLDPDALAGARLCKTRMPDGQLTGDDCIEGVWQYGEGAEVAAKISPQSRHPEYTITVLRQPNTDLAPPGSVVMRNVKWIGKNTYHAECQVRVNNTVTWVATTCTLSGETLRCLDGMIVLTRKTSEPTELPKVSYPQIIDYRPKDDIGAPSNREGTSSR